MAYFPNGSSGEILDRQCEKCPLGRGESGECCPVELVQLHYNYDQCDDGQEKLREAMNILIDNRGICQVGKKLTEKIDQAVSNGIEKFKKDQQKKYDQGQLGLFGDQSN